VLIALLATNVDTPARASGTEPPATAPGHAPIHGSSAAEAAGTHRALGGETKPYESDKAHPNLSEGECKQLGGEVFVTTVCLSGSVCRTSDESGNGHFVCVSKAS
jgi:hypothetical protein